MSEINWDNFGSNESETNKNHALIKPDKYQAILTNVTLEKSKSGNHGFKTEVSIKGGEFDKRKVWKYFYITDGTMKKFIPWQVNALGISDIIKDEKPKNYEDFAMLCFKILSEKLGKEYRIDVSIKEGFGGYPDSNENLFLEEMMSVDETLDKIFKKPDLSKIENKAIKEFDENEELLF